MDLFTYLLAKNNKFSLVHKSDLFSYLLGKNNSIPLKTAEGVTITIEALKTKINELKMIKESTQDGTPTPENPIPVKVVEGYIKDGNNYVDVKVTGKNLFDKNNVVDGYLLENGTVGTASSYKTSDYIPISPNTNYYKTRTGSPRSKYYDINKQPLNTTTYQDIDIGTQAGTFITPANAYYVRLSIYPQTISLDDVQLVPGSVATSYEPYKESIVPIPLNGNFIGGKGDYLDELIVDKSGKCYLNKKITKVVLNGSESWQVNSKQDTFVRVYYNDSNIMIANNNNDIFCKSDKFNAISYANILNPNLNSIAISNNANRMFINVDYSLINVTSSSTNNEIINAFKSWLSTHNTDVYYVLAQEYLIDLNYTIDLKLFRGENNISNSEDMMMTLKYY